MPATKILCVHGIGDAEQIGDGGPNDNWRGPWADAIKAAFSRCNNPDPPQFDSVRYDQLFADTKIDQGEYLEAIGELLGSVVWHAIAGPSAPKDFLSVFKGKISEG